MISIFAIVAGLSLLKFNINFLTFNGKEGTAYLDEVVIQTTIAISNKIS